MAEEEKRGLLARVLRAVPLVGAAVEAIDENIPHLEDEVVVEVVGQPGAVKKDLYFLALAAANGMVRRFDKAAVVFGVGFPDRFLLPPPGVLMLEYDGADNWVRCTLKYETSTLAAATFGVRANVFFDTLQLYAGPDCNVVGDRFQFTSSTDLGSNALGIPTSSTDPNAPKLPFAGRTILTPCPDTLDPDPSRPVPPAGAPTVPSTNPVPPGDGRSRGAVPMPIPPPPPGTPPPRGRTIQFLGRTITLALPKSGCCDVQFDFVPLVFAALTNPGSFAGEYFSGPLPGIPSQG